MREYNRAIQATVRLLALLETMMVNLEVMAALATDRSYRRNECREVAKRIGRYMAQVEKLNSRVRRWIDQEGANSEYLKGKHWQHANGIEALCRKIRRDAVGVARWFNIPTKMLTAKQLVGDQVAGDWDFDYQVHSRYTWEDQWE